MHKMEPRRNGGEFTKHFIAVSCVVRIPRLLCLLCSSAAARCLQGCKSGSSEVTALTYAAKTGHLCPRSAKSCEMSSSSESDSEDAMEFLVIVREMKRRGREGVEGLGFLKNCERQPISKRIFLEEVNKSGINERNLKIIIRQREKLVIEAEEASFF